MAKVEKSGRILLPAAIRRKLNLQEGSQIILRFDGHTLQIATRAQALDRIRGRLRKYISEERNLSEELLRERREEAAREEPK